MIFPNYNYKEYHVDNKSEWPLQPPTQENWNKMVNDAYSYCQLLSPNDYPDGVNVFDLPSFHPYWKSQAEDKTIDYSIVLLEKLKKCILNPELYKTEFRIGACKGTVMKDIFKVLERIV